MERQHCHEVAGPGRRRHNQARPADETEDGIDTHEPPLAEGHVVEGHDWTVVVGVVFPGGVESPHGGVPEGCQDVSAWTTGAQRVRARAHTSMRRDEGRERHDGGEGGGCGDHVGLEEGVLAGSC